MSSKKYNNRINCHISSDGIPFSPKHKHHKNNSHKVIEKSCKLLYSIGAWADNNLVEIKFVPKIGHPISWNVTNNTLNPSSHTHVMQSPITSLQFPIFPLSICSGDKFIFLFNNDISLPNAFACAANIDGILYKTANSTVSLTPYNIVLHPTIGHIIIDPSYSPITDLSTRNIVNATNYISISPNNISDYTLTWKF